MPKRSLDDLVVCDVSNKQRARFSVVVSDAAVSKLVAWEMNDKDTTRFDSTNADQLYEAMSDMRDRELGVVEGILLGALRTTHLEYMKKVVTAATMIVDDGRHVCSREKCVIVPVYGKAFFFEPGRAHICIGLSQCIAPAVFHSGRVTVLSQLLYYCKDSGKAHICTPSACDSVNHDNEGSIVCRLTGKCLGKSKLSAGWIEDNWRTGYNSSAEVRRLEKKALNAQLVAAREESVAVPDRNTDRWRLRCLSVIPALDDIVGRGVYVGNYQKTIKLAYGLIRPLFPGHFSRDKLDVDDISRTMSKVLTKWTQYTRSCRNKKCMVDTTHMQTETAQLTRSLGRKRVHYDPQTFSMICRLHARMIVRYATILFKYTKLSEYELTLTDYVIAILFTQCRSFRVDDFVLIPLDVFLAAHLPNAGNLRLFDHLGSCAFTSTKNDIQACIIDSIDKGCVPQCLTYPTIDLSDMLF